MNTFAYLMIFGMLAALLASVIYGLYWAVSRGQFANFNKGATSIFDDEEPMGLRTDAFPSEKDKIDTGKPTNSRQ